MQSNTDRILFSDGIQTVNFEDGNFINLSFHAILSRLLGQDFFFV